MAYLCTRGDVAHNLIMYVRARKFTRAARVRTYVCTHDVCLALACAHAYAHVSSRPDIIRWMEVIETSHGLRI